ncbi:MAG TPA: PP2C family protein-serine/threonine phosphatase [Trebonia sp.]|nr:PP2C family protein-serine/threonine phosphatase [Trebonia sp.]
MAEFAYAKALQALTAHASVDVDRLLAAGCTPAWDPVVYLADFAREVLLPVTASVPPEPVASSPAGGVFITGESAVTRQAGHTRVWVPVTEQTARIGVLAVSLPGPGPTREDIRQAELLGVFAGLVVAATMRVSDTLRIRRQGRPLSLPASIQWDMMPPWTVRVPRAMAAGILEPAYDIAGDAFDYAVDDEVISFAIFDGMGHGIGATLLTGLAVGTYRHARRAGASLPDMHVAIDHALSAHFDDMSFATGILGTLHTGTGRLEWTCAGHPPPLLLRGGRVTELSSNPTLPFGLDTGIPGLHGLDLKADDVILVYTDGVTEAHDVNRELFGPDRLTTLLERQAGEQHGEELLRSLVRAILDHQQGDLRDDATMLMLRWDGA